MTNEGLQVTMDEKPVLMIRWGQNTMMMTAGEGMMKVGRREMPEWEPYRTKDWMDAMTDEHGTKMRRHLRVRSQSC